MTRGVGGRSPANVQKHLAGVDYPANKKDLVQAARRNDAPNEVMEFVESLPDRDFGGPQDVMEEYGGKE